MITKIKIDGFKTFCDFEMEFAPLTIIAGTNASGKSNLFDAMKLLSRIVETDLKTAFSEQRGDAGELFTVHNNGKVAEEMSFTVELLVNKVVKDRFGGEMTLKYTRLRYAIKLKQTINDRGVNDLIIVSESLNPIRHDEDEWIKMYIQKKVVDRWRPKVLTGRRGVAYIDTENDRINLRQDGGGGMKKEFSLNNTTQAIITVVNSVDFRHALAAKEEIKSWRFLQLNPEDLRQPSSYLDKDYITHTGKNLAAAVHRLKNQDAFILKQIKQRLNSLLPGITSVDVIDDKVGRQFVVNIKTQDGREFTSRVLSEGTLRLLTLCVFLFDPEHNGLLCFEEPENGVHPARIKLTAQLLMDLSSHFEQDEDYELRQVIVNTHSPVLVADMFKFENIKMVRVWFSQLVTKIVATKTGRNKMQTTKMTPVEHGKMQMVMNFSENEKKMTWMRLNEYLNTVDFEQLIQNE